MKKCHLQLESYYTAQFVDVSGQMHLRVIVYFIFYFAIIYFKILSQVSHKRTRARIFGNLAYDI